jgi:hypothetical protein
MSCRERTYGTKECRTNCAWYDNGSGRCLIALSLEANLKNQIKEMTFSDYANMMFINKERTDNNE